MGKCKSVRLLFNMLPVKLWQDFLVRRHLLSCPICSDALAEKEEARAVLLGANDFSDMPNLPPVVLDAVRSPQAQSPSMIRIGWQGAVGALCGLILVAAGIWLSIRPGVDEDSTPSPRFQIHSVRIEDQPARTYVYQVQNSDMTFVWVERNSEGEGE